MKGGGARRPHPHDVFTPSSRNLIVRVAEDDHIATSLFLSPARGSPPNRSLYGPCRSGGKQSVTTWVTIALPPLNSGITGKHLPSSDCQGGFHRWPDSSPSPPVGQDLTPSIAGPSVRYNSSLLVLRYGIVRSLGKVNFAPALMEAQPLHGSSSKTNGLTNFGQTSRAWASAAEMNPANRGCGSNGRLLSSGWNCTPMNHG